MLDRASRETSALVMVVIAFTWSQRKGQVFPVYQISAHRMSPVHAGPESLVWVVLVEKMIFSLVVNQPVRIIEPAGLRHKVVVLAHFALSHAFLFRINLPLGFLDILLH